MRDFWEWPIAHRDPLPGEHAEVPALREVAGEVGLVAAAQDHECANDVCGLFYLLLPLILTTGNANLAATCMLGTNVGGFGNLGSPLQKGDFVCLRAASGIGYDEHGPPVALLDPLAATVTFRKICVERHGLLWMLGQPSWAGLGISRALMPTVLVRTFRVV